MHDPGCLEDRYSATANAEQLLRKKVELFSAIGLPLQYMIFAIKHNTDSWRRNKELLYCFTFVRFKGTNSCPNSFNDDKSS